MTMSGHGHGGRADHDGTPSHSQQQLFNAGSNPSPGNFMTMSGHGHGGRADHDGTPSHSQQGLLNIPRGGHVGTGGKRSCAEGSMIPESALANATSSPSPDNFLTMSGHVHGGRADHDGTPSHSQKVLLNIPRGGHFFSKTEIVPR